MSSRGGTSQYKYKYSLNAIGQTIPANDDDVPADACSTDTWYVNDEDDDSDNEGTLYNDGAAPKN